MGTKRRFRNAVGPLIRRRRNEHALTLEDLAAKLQLAGLDLDGNSIAKIESQIRSVYDYELIVIARVLRIPPDKLFPAEPDLGPMLPYLLKGKK